MSLHPNSDPSSGNPKSSSSLTKASASSKGSSSQNPGTDVPAAARGLATYSKPILYGLGALIVLLVGLFAFSEIQAKKSGEAREALFSARKAYDDELKAVTPQPPAAEPEKTDAKADPKKKPQAPAPVESVAYKAMNVEQVFPKSIAALNKVATQFPNTLSGFQALMFLGNLRADHGDVGNAIGAYEKAALQAPNSLDKLGALAALSQAQETLGNCKQAVETIEKAINLGVGTLKGDLLVSKARCYETLQDKVKAKATYDQILKDLPGTPFSRLAEIYRAKIQ